MTDEEKMVYLDSLGSDAARDAEFSRYKDQSKAIATKAVYDRYRARKGVSAWESGLRGAEQGATMGWGEELRGAAAAYLSPEAIFGHGDKGALYRQARDENRAANKLAQEANPKSYLGGNIVGGGLTGIATGGAATGLGANMLIAGAQGFVSGVGGSEAEDAEGLLKDGFQGGVTGLVAAPVAMGAGKVVGKLVGKIGEAAGDSAALQAFRAAHPTLADLKNIDEERAIEIGRRLLNEDAVKPWNSARGVAKKTAAKRETIGKEMGGYDEILDAKAGPEGLPADEVAEAMADRAQEAYPTPAGEGNREHMLSEADRFSRGYQKRRLSVKELRQDKALNWRKGLETQEYQPTMRAEAHQKLAAEQGAKFDEFAVELDPEVAAKLKDASSRFHDFAQGDEIAQIASAKARNQGSVTLTDLGAVGAGGATFGPAGAAVTLGAKKLLQSRGHSMAAGTLNTIARFAGNKDISGDVARVMLKNPERLEKYLPALVEAAGRSDAAFKAISEKLAGLPDF